MSNHKIQPTPAHLKPENRPMQEAFRVLAKLRNTEMVAVFVYFNKQTLGYRVTTADCSRSQWQDTQRDEEKMARCAGIYRGRVAPEDIADDLQEMGVPLDLVG